jgi:hypothetical protein
MGRSKPCEVLTMLRAGPSKGKVEGSRGTSTG